MKIQSLSKIWIIVAAGIIIAGGFFAWQYWWIPLEKAVVLNKLCGELTIKQCEENPKCGVLIDVVLPMGERKVCIESGSEEVNTSLQLTGETIKLEEESIPSEAILEKWGVKILRNIPIIDSNRISRGIPFFREESRGIFIFDISTHLVKETDQVIGAPFESIEKNTSPDLTKISFPNQKGSLMLLTTDISVKIILVDISDNRITNRQSVRVRRWSEDGQKLIFTIGDDCMGCKPVELEEGEFLKKLQGDYLIDFQKGTIRKFAVPDILAEIDNNRFLIEREASFAILDIETLTIKDIVKKPEGFYFQFNVNAPTDTWVFNYGPRGYGYSEIIFAKFPSLSGKTVEKGGWADLQFPSISPDGQKILYFKKGGEYFPGMFWYDLWLYDRISESNRRILEKTGNLSLTWINNARVVAGSYLYNLNDGSTIIIQ